MYLSWPLGEKLLWVGRWGRNYFELAVGEEITLSWPLGMKLLWVGAKRLWMPYCLLVSLHIFLLQKGLVRALTNANFNAHTAPLFRKLKIVDIYRIISFYILPNLCSLITITYFRYHFLIYSPPVNKSMIITPETQNLTNLMHVEQISNSSLSSFGDQKYGILCPSILSTQRLICFRSRMLNILHLSQ